MDNSHESSIALSDLAKYINPSNFLRWRRNWRWNNPSGERYVGLTDIDDPEEIFVDEKGEFLGTVRQLANRIKNELEELKCLQLDGANDTIDSEKLYGPHLRSMLNKVRESGVMDGYEAKIEKIFLQLENSILKEFKLNIGFTDPNQVAVIQNASDNEIVRNVVENVIDHLRDPTLQPISFAADGVDYDSELTSKPLISNTIEKNERPLKPKEIVRNRTLEESKKYAREQLAFLRKGRGDAPIMDEHDYNKLLEYVDDMLTRISVVEVAEPLQHINQSRVPMEYVQAAFARINYRCFIGIQEWILDSFITIFDLGYRESKKSKWKYSTRKPPY